MSNDKLKKKVWDKAQRIKGENPNEWRRDTQGNKIRYGSYGQQGQHGWEIDHKVPKSKGGSDSLSNLVPLQWEANREKADK